jgi:hypothetical protein
MTSVRVDLTERKFTPADDRLPRMFVEKPLPPPNKALIISHADIQKTFDF